MNLRDEFKQTLKNHQLTPKKYMGQNFLISKKVYEKILETANISKKDEILEVGGGIGYLTILLAKRAKRVLSIEKDKDLFKILEEKTKKHKNIVAIKGDIRYFNPLNYGFKKRKYKVVANLPYYLTSFFLRNFLEKYPPEIMVLLVQKEVAERITTKEKENLLSLSIKFFSEPEIISIVSKESFWPKPKVDSAILKLKIKPKPPIKKQGLFFQVLHIGFSSPRKKLINNLLRLADKESIKDIFQKANLPLNSRPENLSFEDWICLTKNLDSAKMKK